MGTRHLAIVTAWPAVQLVSAGCGGCGWALVVEYAHPRGAIVATRLCSSKGSEHESDPRGRS